MSEKHIFKAISPDTFEVVEFEVEVPDLSKNENIFVQPLPETIKNKIFRVLPTVGAVCVSGLVASIFVLPFFSEEKIENKEEKQITENTDKDDSVIEAKAGLILPVPELPSFPVTEETIRKERLLLKEAEYANAVADYEKSLKLYADKPDYWGRISQDYRDLFDSRRQLAGALGLSSIHDSKLLPLPIPPPWIANIEKQDPRNSALKKPIQQTNEPTENQTFEEQYARNIGIPTIVIVSVGQDTGYAITADNKFKIEFQNGILTSISMVELPNHYFMIGGVLLSDSKAGEEISRSLPFFACIGNLLSAGWTKEEAMSMCKS